MKNWFPWATGLLSVSIISVLAQGPAERSISAEKTASPAPGVTTFRDRTNRVPSRPAAEQPSKELSRFDLDFPGGTPKGLVAAIQEAMGRPLNAIVPDEYVDMKIPPLKMSNVNVQELFAALEQASRKVQAYESASYYGGGQYGGYRSIQQVTTAYGFQQGPGALTDDTIWYFHAEKPPVPTIGGTGGTKAVRFYSLSPYLNRGNGERRALTVDDITTAIETGWKMLGETAPPKISFHKDTNLLIAVGEPDKLQTIDAVLQALAPQAAPAAAGKVAAPRPADSPRSAESSKTGSE